MKKIILFLIISATLLSCEEEKQAFSGLMGFIPPETALILKTEKLENFGEALSENSFFAKNKIPGFSEIEARVSAFSNLKPSGESLLCLSMIGRDMVFAFIAENNSGIFPTDSTSHTINGQYTYDSQKVSKHILENTELYSVVLGEIFVASDSKLILESIIRSFNMGLKEDPQLQKVYEVSSGKASLFVQHKNLEKLYIHLFPNGKTDFLEGFADWTVLDIEAEENGVFLNGVVISEGDIPKKIDLFKGIRPQKNQVAAVVPLNSKGFFSFTYDDFYRLRENIRLYRKTDALPKLPLEALFLSANEIGIVYGNEGQTLVLNSNNEKETEKALLAHTSVAKEFRGFPIYDFSEKNSFQKAFSPLVKNNKLAYYVKIGDFFVFSSNLKALENTIANVQNGSVLGKQPYFKDLSKNLSDEASILLVGINSNLKKAISKNAKGKYQNEIEGIGFQEYKLSALQFVHSDGFAHVNAVFSEAGETNLENGPNQVMALEVESPITGKPQFFEYWRTGEQYVVVQDEKNILYLFDWDGNLKWKKELDGRILGEIQKVDLFKNNRLQMAFATPGKFYVIDRLGSDVSPFPLKFENITQPLSVFDYAGNRDYRFMIVQGEKVSMLDSKGKKVTGFKFNKAGSEVLQAPKHIRIGNKDYILIPEASGKLNVLSRQGTQRVKVEKEIGFSESPWFLYEGKFTSTNSDGDLVQVDEKGKVSTKDIGLSEEHYFTARPKFFVSVSENVLLIGDKEKELDYGLYSKPEIFDMGNKTYISITDTQANKVYLFNEKGNLLPGFPVYGSSNIDLGNLDDEGKLEFIVKGEDNRVLVYRLN